MAYTQDYWSLHAAKPHSGEHILTPHKLSRRPTWKHYTQNTHNQIDYILAPERFTSSTWKLKTKTFRVADMGNAMRPSEDDYQSQPENQLGENRNTHK